MKQYQPLYLKYRPQKLSEVVGQEVVTRTLKNAILFNRIVHAYLFCGPKGTGKTSCARILAKSLNCKNGVTVDPCGECVSCTSIANANSLDVIEIDAASRRKVEDAEDLINRVALGTYGSRYKIYIIDEVHMLTDHAFNALLKTLEEPPKNVIFILATTEEYKILPTIISRCQKLSFKPLPVSLVEERIRQIASAEKVNLEERVVKFISRRSSGCLRDAISLLDQVSVLQEGEKKISVQDIYNLFGTADRQLLFKLAGCILTFDKKAAIDLAEELVKSGKDVSEILKDLLEAFIDLARAKIDASYKETLKSEFEENLELVDKLKQDHLLKIITVLQDSQSKLRFAFSQELQFLAQIISLLDEDFLISICELRERIDKLEREQPSSGVPWHATVKEAPESSTAKEMQTQDRKSIQDSKEDSSKETLDTIWGKIVSNIDSSPTKALLSQSDSYLTSLSDETVEIGLSKSMFLPRLKDDTKKKEIILRAVAHVTGKTPTQIKFKVAPKEKKVKVQTKQEAPIVQEQNSTHVEPVNQNISVSPTPSDDELSGALKELLGAKEINC